MKKSGFFKALIFAVILICAITLLGGCGSNQDKPVQDTAGQDTESPVPSVSVNDSWTVVNDVSYEHSVNYAGFLNENYGITVGFGGEIHYTTDGGKNWPIGKNKSRCRFSLDIVDENLAWSGGNGNQIRVTKDGGATWQEVTDFEASGFHYNVSFIDDKNGWVGSSKMFASTNDGGSTWKNLVLPEGEDRIQALFLRTVNNGYLLTPNGHFYTTNDDGQTWKMTDLKLSEMSMDDKGTKVGMLNTDHVPMADINFTDEKNGMIVFMYRARDVGLKTWMMTTTDGGETWENKELAFPEGFIPNSVYITRDGGYMTITSSSRKLLVLKREEGK